MSALFFFVLTAITITYISNSHVKTVSLPSLTEKRNPQEQKVITPSSVTNLENFCRTGDMATFLDVSGSSPIAYIGLGELYRYISCEGPPEPVTEYVEIDVAWSFFFRMDHKWT